MIMILSLIDHKNYLDKIILRDFSDNKRKGSVNDGYYDYIKEGKGK